MGLLGKILGLSVGPSTPIGEGVPPGLLGHVVGMLRDQTTGGLGGLVGQLSQGSLGNAVASWISTRPNLPVSADQITSALGPGQIQAMAAKLGIPVDKVAGHLAQFLPEIINHLTPTGQVPDAGAVESSLSLLQGRLGR